MEKNIGEATVNSCPFCGSADVEYEAESTFNSPYVWCRGCDKKFNFIQLSDWNTRPIEDALTQRVKVLEVGFQNVLNVLGPNVPSHLKGCPGCQEEWAEAIRIAEEALAPPVGEKEK